MEMGEQLHALPLKKWLLRPHSRYGNLGEEKYILSCQESSRDFDVIQAAA